MVPIRLVVTAEERPLIDQAAALLELPAASAISSAIASSPTRGRSWRSAESKETPRMTILLYMTQALFALIGVGLFVSFRVSRRMGVLLTAMMFGGAAAASFAIMAWWPLLVGFVLACVLRLSGFDRSPQ